MPLKPVSRIVIGTASQHPREMHAARELRALLVAHDVSGLQWTSQVTINRHGVAHSHPALVLTTQDQGDDLLGSYVHQQLHWWTEARPELKNAIADTQQTWATVPTSNGGGANTEAQTRMHLTVCHLEQRAMHHVAGDVRSRMLLRQHITTGHVFPWIYRQVHLHSRELDRICNTRNLWPPRLEPGH